MGDFRVTTSGNEAGGNALIADQIAYYRARANEYDDSLRKLERYVSLGGSVAGRHFADEDHQEIAILLSKLDGLPPFGSALELACGTGWWTQWLAHRAEDVTAGGAGARVAPPDREG